MFFPFEDRSTRSERTFEIASKSEAARGFSDFTEPTGRLSRMLEKTRKLVSGMGVIFVFSWRLLSVATFTRVFAKGESADYRSRLPGKDLRVCPREPVHLALT